MDLRTTRVLEGCMVIRAVALHLERTARRANATLDARARTRWLHGCSICAGLNWRVGDGPCRCRAPTRTRPTPTQKVLPAARGVRLGCAWAYSATTITRHGSRAAILGAGAQLKVASFLGAIHKGSFCWFVCFLRSERAGNRMMSTLGYTRAPLKNTYMPAMSLYTSTPSRHL